MPYGSWVNDLAAGFFFGLRTKMDGTVILA